jgi:glycine cleavage system aminomethyltransferase T
MTIPSPLHELLEQFEMEHVVEYDGVQREGASIGEFKTQLLSEFLPWGESGSSVLATSGYVELEYASIQKSTGIFDASCRGTIQLTGEDRLECINRLSTQQLLDMNEGESRLAFITSRLGSIIADAIIHVLQDRILVDVDITVVNQVCEHISSYIVMEEVDVQDVTDMTH